MPFPNDLSDVAVFKVHPALGVARLSNSDDHYEFFDYERKRKDGHNVKYMSPQRNPFDEKTYQTVKRQAVQFTIFAYDKNGLEVGELSKDAMLRLGITATWSAKIANRKLNTWNEDAQVVSASGEATGDLTVRLEGPRPWPESTLNCHTRVWLGELTGSGLFLPPKGGVYRKNDSTEIPDYGRQTDNGFQDTTSDGAIGVRLAGAERIPVVPAAVLVAPQQHSPDVNPGTPGIGGQNLDFVEQTRKLLDIDQDQKLPPGRGYEMDVEMMRTINAEYNPGMEICLDKEENPALPDPKLAFYPRGEDHFAKAEIRPRYESGQVKHGALTAGLCSAWQTDLSACLDFWTAEFPHYVYFEESPAERPLSRKLFLGKEIDRRAEWLNAYIDNMDIARNLRGDINRLQGTERDADVGDKPRPPFSKDAPQ